MPSRAVRQPLGPSPPRGALARCLGKCGPRHCPLPAMPPPRGCHRLGTLPWTVGPQLQVTSLEPSTQSMDLGGARRLLRGPVSGRASSVLVSHLLCLSEQRDIVSPSGQIIRFTPFSSPVQIRLPRAVGELGWDGPPAFCWEGLLNIYLPSEGDFFSEMKACFLEVWPYPQLFLITPPPGGAKPSWTRAASPAPAFPALSSPDLTRQP